MDFCWDIGLFDSIFDHHRAMAAEQNRQLTINPKQSNWTTMSHVIFPNFDEPESTRFHGVCFTHVFMQTSTFETVSHLSSSSHLSKGNWLQGLPPGMALGPDGYWDGSPKGTRCLVFDLTLGTLIHQSRIIQQNPKHNKQKPRFKSVFLNVCKTLELWLLNLRRLKKVTWKLTFLTPLDLSLTDFYTSIWYQPFLW